MSALPQAPSDSARSYGLNRRSQKYPVAAPAGPPSEAPVSGLPPVTVPGTAPPAAPAAPPVMARCCCGLRFAHATVATNTITSKSPKRRSSWGTVF
jgi:hypothetical protein